MFAAVQRVGNELDQGMIDRLVPTFKRRCELCQICRGRTISQLLSSGIQMARPQDIGAATGFHPTPELDQRPLEVGAEAKGRASWKRIVDLPEFAEFTATALKQRWQFLVHEAGNAHWQQLRSSLELVDEEEVDADAFDGMAPEELPSDGDEQLDMDVLAGDDEEDEGDHAQESSSDDEPPPAPSAKRTYITFAAAHEQDPELAQMPGARCRVLLDTEKAEWAARAPSATPIAPSKRGRGRPMKFIMMGHSGMRRCSRSLGTSEKTSTGYG
jgi:hypothetical protein